jgi:hypothetical protein
VAIFAGGYAAYSKGKTIDVDLELARMILKSETICSEARETIAELLRQNRQPDGKNNN